MYTPTYFEINMAWQVPLKIMVKRIITRSPSIHNIEHLDSSLQQPPRNLLHKKPMLLMPFLKTSAIIRLMDGLFTLRPPRPRRLRPAHDTHHFIRNREFRVNGRSKWMNELRPMVIPKPKHRTAIWAKDPLRWANFFLGSSTVFDRVVLSEQNASVIACYIWIRAPGLVL